MGKFTTGVLLFFSFFIFSFEIQAASSCAVQAGQRGTCYQTLSGGGCKFGIELCEQQNCTVAKGRYWDSSNNICSTTKPQELQQVAITAKKCSTLGGAYDSSDVCRCPNGAEINMKGDVGQCSGSSDEAKCKALGGEHTAMPTAYSYGCLCVGTPNAIDVNGPQGQCSNASSNTNSNQNSDNGMTLQQCLDGFQKRADTCKTQADQAKTNCDQTKAGDSTIGMGKDIVNMAGEVYKAKEAAAAKANGVDNSSSCATVGLGLFTILKGMDAFKSTCDTEFNECKTSCDAISQDVAGDKLTIDCTQAAQVNGVVTPADTARIKAAAKALETKVAASTKVCKVDAAAEQNLLADALTGYSNSATQAKVCECQKVTGSTACVNTPSAADCLVGGSQYGSTACLAYGDCSVGTANYSSVTCQCQRDSTLAVCKTAAAAVVSNFSGIDSKLGSSTAAGVPTSTGSTGADGLDLGSFAAQKAAGTTTDAATTANPGLTTGGGGGGGGGGSAPNADVGGAPAAAAGEGEGGAGSGGVFGQIKSMFGMGGSSSKTNSAASKGATTANPDLSKWLKGQKRCMASVDDCKQVNPANKEIFDIMKDRYNKLSNPLDPYLK